MEQSNTISLSQGLTPRARWLDNLGIPYDYFRSLSAESQWVHHQRLCIKLCVSRRDIYNTTTHIPSSLSALSATFERGTPTTSLYMLYGAPGSGKTTFAWYLQSQLQKRGDTLTVVINAKQWCYQPDLSHFYAWWIQTLVTALWVSGVDLDGIQDFLPWASLPFSRLQYHLGKSNDEAEGVWRALHQPLWHPLAENAKRQLTTGSWQVRALPAAETDWQRLLTALESLGITRLVVCIDNATDAVYQHPVASQWLRRWLSLASAAPLSVTTICLRSTDDCAKGNVQKQGLDRLWARNAMATTIHWTPQELETVLAKRQIAVLATALIGTDKEVTTYLDMKTRHTPRQAMQAVNECIDTLLTTEAVG